MHTDTFLGLTASGFHKISYTDWGNPTARRAVICVHGLTRNGRDFDALAQELAGEFRVVCPDVAGRGRSDWLYNKDDYSYPQYLADMNALISRVLARPRASGLLDRLVNLIRGAGGPEELYWVGTSMGGIIGMLLASRPNSPIKKLVVNDVGPFIPKASLDRIGHYVGKDPRFKTYEELETYIRTISAPFGPLTDAQWHHLSVTGAKQHADGTWGMSYDPGIANVFKKGPMQDIDLWPFWDTITCPTLILRGADSDLLLHDTAAEMQKRGPHAKLVEFAGIGHAPMLMAPDQIKVVTDFLRAP